MIPLAPRVLAQTRPVPTALLPTPAPAILLAPTLRAQTLPVQTLPVQIHQVPAQILLAPTAPPVRQILPPVILVDRVGDRALRILPRRLLSKTSPRPSGTPLPVRISRTPFWVCDDFLGARERGRG